MNSLDFFYKNDVDLNESIKLDVQINDLEYRFKLTYYNTWVFTNIDKISYDMDIITYDKVINMLKNNILQHFNNKELRKKEILKKLNI